MYRTIVTALTSTAILLAHISSAAPAPQFFVDANACPFECCVYRDWKALRSVTLYAEPNEGSQIVGDVAKDMTAKAETGQVHTIPGKLIVDHETVNFDKGEVIWVYTYRGEGYFKIWRGGEYVNQDLGFGPRDLHLDGWGHFVSEPVSVWWAYLTIPTGLSGWTNRPENFTNKDACS